MIARLNLCGKRVVCRAVGFYGVTFGSFAVNALVRNFNYFIVCACVCKRMRYVCKGDI